MSRKRRRINDTKNVIARDAKSHNRHSQDNLLVEELGFGTRPRQFLTRLVWKRLGGGRIVYVYESIKYSNLFPSAANENNNFVRAVVTGFLSFEPITEHSIKLTYVLQLKLGGFIPRQVIDLGAVGMMSASFIEMRESFSKDYEIDSEKRRGLLVGKLNSTHEHSKVESDEIERGKLLFKQFRNSESGIVTVKTDNELVSAVAVQFEGKAWCRLSTTVRCGGGEALAFLLSVDSRSLVSEHDLKLSEVVTDERRLDENDKRENNKGHTQVVSMLESNVLSDGTKVCNSMNRRTTWKIVDGKWCLYSSPTTVLEKKKQRIKSMASFGLRRKEIPTVYDESVAATKITQVSETECKIEMIFDPILKKRKSKNSIGMYQDIGVHHSSAGSVQTKTKKELVDALPTNRDYRTLNRMQMKFQNWRKLESGLDESDGKAMGEMLMANSSNLLSKNRTKKMKERRVKHFFEEFNAIRTMKTELPFFEKMIMTVIVGENGKEKGRHSEVSERAERNGGGELN